MQRKFVPAFLAGAAAVAALVAMTPATASAQLGFVAQASFGDDTDFGVGGGVRFDLGKLTTQNGIRGEATFDYFFPDGNYDYWELNGNGMVDIKSVPGLYVGAGINYAHTSGTCNGLGCNGGDYSNGDVGLNLLGGWDFGGARTRPFVQAKFELGHGDQLVISGGIRF